MNKEIIVSTLGINRVGRVAYLDMLKCLGMFIVVSGHIHTAYGWFSLPIHSFVIPLFFMLSGMTFRRSKFPRFCDFAKHRAKSLLLPYAMFSFITWVFWALYSYLTHAGVASYMMPLLQTVFAQGSGHYLIHNVPLWFIPCLFVVEMIYYWLDKLPDSLKIVSSLILAVIGSLMIHVWKGLFLLLPWSIESAFVSVVFYCFGNLIVKYFGLKGIETKVLSNRVLSLLIIILFSVVLVFTSHYNKHISLGSDILGVSPILFYFNAFIGIISVSLYSILVCAIPAKSSFFRILMDYHLWFGKNSFYIMATHVPVKGIIMTIIATIIGKSVKYVGNDWVCMPVVFVLTCAICSLLAVLIGIMKRNDEKCMLSIKNNLKNNGLL